MPAAGVFGASVCGNLSAGGCELAAAGAEPSACAKDFDPGPNGEEMLTTGGLLTIALVISVGLEWRERL